MDVVWCVQNNFMGHIFFFGKYELLIPTPNQSVFQCILEHIVSLGELLHPAFSKMMSFYGKYLERSLLLKSITVILT